MSMQQRLLMQKETRLEIIILGSLAGTGGVETTYSSGGTDYSVHTFTEDGVYTSAVTADTDYFIVAGGGSGGGQPRCWWRGWWLLDSSGFVIPCWGIHSNSWYWWCLSSRNGSASSRNRWDKYHAFWPRWFFYAHSIKGWGRSRCRSCGPNCFLVSRSWW